MARRRSAEAVQRFEARRKREDDAPRLADLVPTLKTLKLNVYEYDEGGDEPVVNYVRHIIVQRAPAMFLIPCGDSDCEDGGYDVTRELMEALEAGEATFERKHKCDGHRKESPCQRSMRYVASATYG